MLNVDDDESSAEVHDTASNTEIIQPDCEVQNLEQHFQQWFSNPNILSVLKEDLKRVKSGKLKNLI